MTEMPREIRTLRTDLANHGDEMVTVVAYLTPRPGREADTEELLLSLVGPTRQEPGCVDYVLHRTDGDPCVFMFYENWRTREDLDRHLEMPHLVPLFERKDELLAEDIAVRLMTMTSTRSG